MKAITLKAARIVGELAIEIDWSTGETLTARMSGWLRPPMDALNDPAVFNQMLVDEWGHGLDWPGGLALGADTLYDLCRRQAGQPSASEFNEWMQRQGLSLSAAAEALGMTRRMIAHYRTGSRPIPKVVGLACLGFESRTHAGKASPVASSVAFDL